MLGKTESLILPTGMTAAEAWNIHSMPDLLADLDVCSFPQDFKVQLVPHRGIPDQAKGIPDGSMRALRRAVVGNKGDGGNAVALDVLWIDGKPCVMHDSAGDRKSGQRMPKDIQKDVKDGKVTKRYVPTNSPVTLLWDCLHNLLVLNSEATIFLDSRDGDAEKLMALISHDMAYQANVVIQLHAYAYENGDKFVKKVRDLNPASSWKHLVAVVPVLNPQALPTLAGLRSDSLDYAALYAAGKAWITSMIKTEMRIFGLGFPVSGIGHGVNLATGDTLDLNGDRVDEPRVKAIFLWDRVLLDLVAWAKETHPILAIIMYFYSYNNVFHTGHPIAREEGAESHGKELMAVPGNALRLGAHIVICDRVNDNLNAILGTKKYTWPTNVASPRRPQRR